MPVIGIRPIYTQGFDLRKAKDAIKKTLKDEGKTMTRLFGKTDDTWDSDRPRMSHRTSITMRQAYVWAGPLPGKGEENWIRLDKGTEPHAITAVNAPLLAFPYAGVPGRSYKAKTHIRQFRSTKGGKLNLPIYRPFSVWHPGFKGREWSDEMLRQRIEPFATAMQANVAVALKQAQSKVGP